MVLNHVYQPLLIKYLALKSGRATVRDLAVLFLTGGEQPIAYLEERIRRMPVPVLVSHGVIEVDGDVVRLNVPALTTEEVGRLVKACERRLEEFVGQRGLVAQAVAVACRDPVPDVLRGQARARGA
ncbi:MAG: hypothetical protein K6T75_11700 [Acetobacteraceae bacterium]|nr:hypothetical protein [Acetobacteraceae bacterium]